MKTARLILIVSFLVAASTGIQASSVSAPNGDFVGGSTGWNQATDGPTVYSYPTAGGNPDDYAGIDFTTGTYAVLFSDPVTLGTLGLTDGSSYVFSVDMINLAGPGSVGGLKIEFFTGASKISDTGDMNPAVIGDGSSWETYDFNVAIPAGTDNIKFVLLWGGASSNIGFDNVGVDNTPLAPITEIPNGDFETTAGAMWDTSSGGGGTFSFDFPAAGGNPNGHGVIDHTANDGGFGVLVSNNSDAIPMSGLGLVAGSTYKFSQDMKIFDGTTNNIGGLKVDFFNGAAANGSTNDVYPALIGTGATWETYDFNVAIPIGTDGIKVVALHGPGSKIGYDNITFDSSPIPTAPITSIPNGDFETTAGAMWMTDSGGGGTFAFDFPASGGNPDGHGVIDHSADDGGFGVLVSNDGNVIPLSGLGLVAGSNYKFSQDMKNLDGPGGVGGMKVEFFTGAADNGDTGDMNPALIGDGSTWATYDFNVAIPAGTDGIKVVPLWGAGSRVGYDNVTFDPTPVAAPPITEIPNGDFETAGGADWNEAGDPNTTFTYPAGGGNPDGHAVMNNNGSGFGVLVSNGGGIIPISGLGLAAGNTYKFSQDMKIISGSSMGGLKVEFYTGAAGNGTTGDKFPISIPDPANWQTYDFYATLPAGTDGIKVVPLWGAGSEVGYDNLTFDPTPTTAPPITEIPNGDFEGGSVAWAEGGAPNTTFSYPTSGGNPNRYGVMTNDGSGFGIWISNSNGILPISGLGLTAGQTYIFSQDMTILSGSNVGGMKVEFFSGGAGNGTTLEMFPALIGTGATWETYDFQVTLPAGTDGIKVVPLWGAGSSVGYDNITFSTTPVIVPLIPNGDFENGSASWFEDGTNTTFDYPGVGGNPDGFGTMDNTGAGAGLLVANGGAPMTLDSLGLAGGDMVTFNVDMRIFAGSNIGGLRLEYFQGGTLLGGSGDLFPAIIGSGGTWETYSFEVMFPAGADNLKLILISGLGSEVGYDNVEFMTAEQVPFEADIALGTVVSWATSSDSNLYQPQESANNVDWTNLGPALVGNAVSSAFDPDNSAFYRVLETVVPPSDAIINGGFEISDGGTCAESWTCFSVSGQEPMRITSDFFEGMASIQIKVENDLTPTPNISELQHNVFAAGGTITPGETYDFSFRAKQVSSGVSYVQEYRVQWLAPGGAIVSDAVGWTTFAGGMGTWAEISNTGLVAPVGAETAFIQIVGKTGAVPDLAAEGEVLVDTVKLEGVVTGPPTVENVDNGDFEVVDGTCAQNWDCAGDDPPQNVVFDSNSEITSMSLLVNNLGTAASRTSELSQNIADTGGSITPGVTYDFSFFAKDGSIGGPNNYMQEYRVQWLDGVGSAISDAIPWTSFAVNNSAWSEISVTGLVAPAGAASALIEFKATTGAVGGATGEVLIDDVSFASMPAPNILPASSGRGVEVSWETEVGSSYEVECNTDLTGWVGTGVSIAGDGSSAAVTDLITLAIKYYRVLKTTP